MARVLRSRADDWARLMAREMGKPLRDGLAEAQKCALCCEFFADNAATLLAREPVQTEARSSFVTFQPLGVVLAVMPWNFPFWQVFRFAAPALMAGNAVVLKLRDALHRQVEESVRRGARCLLGGTIPAGPGAYYPPTVLTDVRKGMPAFDEELFGPVAAVVAVHDEAQAIAAANDSVFGLGAAVITRDLARGERIAAQLLEAGCVFVNDSVRSDPRLPFGGVKESGYGRELSGYGIKEFVNIKTVLVA